MFGKRGKESTWQLTGCDNNTNGKTPTAGKDISVAQFLISCSSQLADGDTHGAIFG